MREDYTRILHGFLTYCDALSNCIQMFETLILSPGLKKTGSMTCGMTFHGLLLPVLKSNISVLAFLNRTKVTLSNTVKKF